VRRYAPQAALYVPSRAGKRKSDKVPKGLSRPALLWVLLVAPSRTSAPGALKREPPPEFISDGGSSCGRTA
jgi:hypothetical protein